jgi:hypothetical protein
VTGKRIAVPYGASKVRDPSHESVGQERAVSPALQIGRLSLEDLSRLVAAEAGTAVGYARSA